MGRDIDNHSKSEIRHPDSSKQEIDTSENKKQQNKKEIILIKSPKRKQTFQERQRWNLYRDAHTN